MPFNLASPPSVLFDPSWDEGFDMPRLKASPYKEGEAFGMDASFALPEVWRFARHLSSPSEAVAWLDWCDAHGDHRPFTLRLEDGSLAGFLVVLRRGKGTIEIGGWLSHTLWGQGLGREMLAGVCRKAQQCGEKMLVADVDKDHSLVRRLLTTVGFYEEGGLFYLELSPWESGMNHPQKRPLKGSV